MCGTGGGQVDAAASLADLGMVVDQQLVGQVPGLMTLGLEQGQVIWTYMYMNNQL